MCSVDFEFAVKVWLKVLITINFYLIYMYMKGLGVSNAQKEQLLKLSSELNEYDRRPLVFEPRAYKTLLRYQGAIWSI